MSSIYKESTHPKISAVSGVLDYLVELAYVPSDEDKGTMAEARILGDKEIAIKKIKELGFSAEHKLELLNFKLQIVKTFDWIKIEEFKNNSGVRP